MRKTTRHTVNFQVHGSTQREIEDGARKILRAYAASDNISIVIEARPTVSTWQDDQPLSYVADVEAVVHAE